MKSELQTLEAVACYNENTNKYVGYLKHYSGIIAQAETKEELQKRLHHAYINYVNKVTDISLREEEWPPIDNKQTNRWDTGPR